MDPMESTDAITEVAIEVAVVVEVGESRRLVVCQATQERRLNERGVARCPGVLEKDNAAIKIRKSTILKEISNIGIKVAVIVDIDEGWARASAYVCKPYGKNPPSWTKLGVLASPTLR
jgi:hypothetical protein